MRTAPTKKGGAIRPRPLGSAGAAAGAAVAGAAAGGTAAAGLALGLDLEALAHRAGEKVDGQAAGLFQQTLLDQQL